MTLLLLLLIVTLRGCVCNVLRSIPGYLVRTGSWLARHTPRCLFPGHGTRGYPGTRAPPGKR
eukprot:3033159-Rhodomonas_salina.2